MVNIFEKRVYLLLNKPKGYVSTRKDPLKRPIVTDLVKKKGMTLFPVGRLDYDAEGLLIMTNDGDLCHRLTHPSKKVEKVYLVKVKGVPDRRVLKKMEKGVPLEDGKTAPSRIIPQKSSGAANSWVKVILHEGRYRQLKRMFEYAGHPVLKIKRVGYACLTLGDLTPGDHRMLTSDEVKMLKDLKTAA